MAKKDFYELLGVQRNASAEDIRRPIANWPCSITPTAIPGTRSAEQNFKDLSEAYDVLKDEQRRAAYDRFGHAAFEMAGAAAAVPAISASLRGSPTSSTRCSANSWAGRRGQGRQ